MDAAREDLALLCLVLGIQYVLGQLTNGLVLGRTSQEHPQAVLAVVDLHQNSWLGMALVGVVAVVKDDAFAEVFTLAALKGNVPVRDILQGSG